MNDLKQELVLLTQASDDLAAEEAQVRESQYAATRRSFIDAVKKSPFTTCVPNIHDPYAPDDTLRPTWADMTRFAHGFLEICVMDPKAHESTMTSKSWYYLLSSE